MQGRTYLAVLGGSLAGLAGCRGGSQEYGDWFENVDNDDGEADRTDESTVTVAVGADDGFAFEPAAICVTTGTTVVWEWTGEGGRHNVVERDGAFASEYHRDEGATFRVHPRGSRSLPLLLRAPPRNGDKGSGRVE